MGDVVGTDTVDAERTSRPSRRRTLFRRIPGVGAQLYFGDTGHCKYGGECKSFPGNGCNTSAGEYGRQQLFVYLPGYRHHIKCGKKC